MRAYIDGSSGTGSFGLVLAPIRTHNSNILGEIYLHSNENQPVEFIMTLWESESRYAIVTEYKKN